MIPEDNNFSVSIPRKLTSFRVKELLFDFHLGHLEESTFKAMAEFLEHDADCRAELEKIKRADAYCFQISKIYVTEDLERQVLDSATYWSLFSKKLHIKNWPPSIALFAESLSVGVLIFLLLNYIPWKSVQDWWKVSFDSIQIAHNSGKEADFNPTILPENKPSLAPVADDALRKTEQNANTSVTQNKLVEKSLISSSQGSENNLGHLLSLLPGTLEIPFVGARATGPNDTLAAISTPESYEAQTEFLKMTTKSGLQAGIETGVQAGIEKGIETGIENGPDDSKVASTVLIAENSQNEKGNLRIGSNNDQMIATREKNGAGSSKVTNENPSGSVDALVINRNSALSTGATQPIQSGAKSPTEALAKPSAKILNGEKRRGYVFRLFMNLSHLSQVSEPIAEKIRSLGGKKAGDVPLGWKRGQGSYYHFTIPEGKMDELVTQLKSYGPVKLSKDPHPRVMPEGEARLILWIESLDGKKLDTSSVNKSGNSAETTTDEVHEVPLDPAHSDHQE